MLSNIVEEIQKIENYFNITPVYRGTGDSYYSLLSRLDQINSYIAYKGRPVVMRNVMSQQQQIKYIDILEQITCPESWFVFFKQLHKAAKDNYNKLKNGGTIPIKDPQNGSQLTITLKKRNAKINDQGKPNFSIKLINPDKFSPIIPPDVETPDWSQVQWLARTDPNKTLLKDTLGPNSWWNELYKPQPDDHIIHNLFVADNYREITKKLFHLQHIQCLYTALREMIVNQEKIEKQEDKSPSNAPNPIIEAYKNTLTMCNRLTVYKFCQSHTNESGKVDAEKAQYSVGFPHSQTLFVPEVPRQAQEINNLFKEITNFSQTYSHRFVLLGKATVSKTKNDGKDGIERILDLEVLGEQVHVT